MSSNKIVKYTCPFCDKKFTRADLVIHIDEEHNELLPEGFTALRYVFNYVNKKPLDYHGICTECKGPTDWDENKGRYNRQCNKKSCRESYLKKFEANMIRTKGVTRISSTAEGQEKMLANRKISGTYTFSNGVKKTYTGSYELKTLQFMDKVMKLNPDDILCPGPVLEYVYEEKKHLYITDFLYIPYNLIIEVKDGGKRPNNRDMPEYRGKQIAKEEYIIKHTEYNYLRLTDNDLSQLLSVFSDLKMQLVDNTGDRVIHVNEAMSGMISAPIIGFDSSPDSVFVVNYMQNNVFTGEPEEGYLISDNIKLENLIGRNKEGILTKAPKNFLEKCQYSVYRVKNITPEIISEKLSPYIGEFVEEGFLYETLFGKKLYTYDQIELEENAEPVMDFYEAKRLLEQICKNYIKGKPNDKVNSLLEAYHEITKEIGIDSRKKHSLKLNGFYITESPNNSDFYLKSETPIKEDSKEWAFLCSIGGVKING